VPAVTSAADASDGDLELSVRVFDDFGVSEKDLNGATEEAARLLEGVGLRLAWLRCPRGSKATGCHRPLGGGEVMVKLAGAFQLSNRGTAAMGYAFVNPAAPYARLANVFVDLVRAASRQGRMDLPVLMGRAMAHEIGHLLINSNGHAQGGLMRAVWSTAELRRDADSDWRFAENEGLLMRTALIAARQ